MMHRHGTLLGVNTRAKHGGGAEKHTDVPGVHVGYHAVFRPLRALLRVKATVVFRYPCGAYDFFVEDTSADNVEMEALNERIAELEA